MGSARRKLNVAYLNGCLLAAAAFGWLALSWAVFLVVLAVGVACAVHGGDIRPTAGRR